MKRSLDIAREWQRRSVERSRKRAREKHDYRIRRIGRNRARQKREHERAYGPKAKWLRTLPSVASNRYPTVCSHINPKDRGELPHGTGRKHGSEWTVPLTVDEEREMHRIGQDSFEAKYRVDLTDEAEHYERAWQERTDVAMEYVERAREVG